MLENNRFLLQFALRPEPAKDRVRFAKPDEDEASFREVRACLDRIWAASSDEKIIAYYNPGQQKRGIMGSMFLRIKISHCGFWTLLCRCESDLFLEGLATAARTQTLARLVTSILPKTQEWDRQDTSFSFFSGDLSNIVSFVRRQCLLQTDFSVFGWATHRSLWQTEGCQAQYSRWRQIFRR